MKELKQVNIILENKKNVEFFNPLRQKLQEAGMGCKLYSEEDMPAQLIGESELWITDSPFWAEYFGKNKAPYVIYLHSGNEEQEFDGARFGLENPEEVEVRYLEDVYRRSRGLPWDIVETDRCLIRETIPDDVEAFYQIYNNPAIVAFMENLYPKVRQEKQYVRDYIDKVYAFYNFGIWTVLLKETGEVIGRAGFCYREGYDAPEIGFMIGVSWQRQGIAYEICRSILEYGREELFFESVQALVEPGNLSSLNLCAKLGFFQVKKVWEDGKEYFWLRKKL